MEELELERVDANGRKKYYAMNLVPEIDRYGEVCSVLSVSRDISELKAGQQRLEDSGAQLRALTIQREETREDERKRIARELHDELGQRLTALRLDISRLRLRFGQENPALLEQVLEMVASVDATIHVVRNVAARLRPAVLDMGIVSALEWLTADFGKRSEINCALLIPQTDIILDDSQSTVIFRIVQESLTNIMRHAQAKNVRISLSRGDDSYLLVIQDDGKGFDPCARPKIGSFGLLGIQERVLMLGGEFSIESSPGKGVKLCVRLANALMI
jgi:signal transduction histidine kinase